MDTELRRVDRLAKSFDRELMARRSMDGVIQVCQLRRIWEPVDIDSQVVLVAKEVPFLVFSLTEDWSTRTRGVSWGIEPLYHKFLEIGMHRRDEMFREHERYEERQRESKERDLRNMFEGLADESHAVFKKTFNDVNTSSMDKTKDPRRIERG